MAFAPERSTKVLEGWGGTELPDPPARLRQAVDEGCGRGIAGSDVEWLPRQPPALGVPKHSAFMGIEFQFLLKDKHVSPGMLVLYHGHTLKVQGLEEPFVTYSLTAGAH